MKERGILLPIFSLPSDYGIGDFGKEAFEFIDILSENGIEYWEILPINEGNGLPYSPVSYYALEEDYISLDWLFEHGLIEMPEKRAIKGRAVYDDFKVKYYKEAFEKFKEHREVLKKSNDFDYYDEFVKNEEIIKYASFRNEETGEEKEYYLFLQYVAYRQWMEIKGYANLKNVKIIGDMPMYPVFNSAETEFHSDYFEMENGAFTFEAGAPPDYYNVEGQKWNCPVYNVANIRRDNYDYLVKRFVYQLHLFDKVRVDYFRGYDAYYKIPFGKSARDGFYSDGVSYGFFDRLFADEDINIDNLIVEDLGDIRDETIRLRDNYGFTRQKILLFSLDLHNGIDNDNEDENVLMFPSNHDCQTIYEWYESLDDEYKTGLRTFLRDNECNDDEINVGIMQYCMKCKARMVVVTVQDVLGLDGSARINLPGVEREENWSWKLKDFTELREKIKKFS